MFTQKTESICNLGELIFRHGRTRFEDGGLVLPLSACGFGIRFRGSCIAVGFKPADYSDQPVYVALVVDGVRHKSSVTLGTEKAVVDGLPEGEHTLKFYRESVGTLKNLTVNEITVSGRDPAFMKDDSKYGFKLLVLGDSITCGYGNLGHTNAYFAHQESATQTYGFIAGEKLNADTRLVGWSGRGVVCSCGGERSNRIIDYFDKTERGSQTVCNDGWQPDVAVINIGTNDAGGRARSDEFKEGIITLTKAVRKAYPNALILYFYGMMGSGYNAAYLDALAEINKTDKNVFYTLCKSIYNDDDDVGSNGHPSYIGQLKAAELLTKEVEKIWKK